jgi:DNA-binding MarR family transcriptional regulator
VTDLPPTAPDRSPRSVGFLLSQLGFVTSGRFASALEPVGLLPREWSLLRFVAASEGQSQQALAEQLAIPPSRMVALVDALEERGLLERRPDPEDRRVRALHLTPEGHRALARAAQVAVEVESRLCSVLDETEREQLIDLLQKIQAEQVDRPGVHPGIARDHPASGRAE